MACVERSQTIAKVLEHGAGGGYVQVRCENAFFMEVLSQEQILIGARSWIGFVFLDPFDRVHRMGTARVAGAAGNRFGRAGSCRTLSIGRCRAKRNACCKE